MSIPAACGEEVPCESHEKDPVRRPVPAPSGGWLRTAGWAAGAGQPRNNGHGRAHAGRPRRHQIRISHRPHRRHLSVYRRAGQAAGLELRAQRCGEARDPGEIPQPAQPWHGGRCQLRGGHCRRAGHGPPGLRRRRGGRGAGGPAGGAPGHSRGGGQRPAGGHPCRLPPAGGAVGRGGAGGGSGRLCGGYSAGGRRDAAP